MIMSPLTFRAFRGPQVTSAGSVTDELERGDGAALETTSSASAASLCDDENTGAETSTEKVRKGRPPVNIVYAF